MNKKVDSKPQCTKTFVRNTELRKPKTVVINEYELKKAPIKKPEVKKSSKTETDGSRNTKLDTPDVHSALMIARKIEAVENVKPRRIKSVSSLQDSKKLAVDEKITRKVNFPIDQPIYKDLIPLCVRPQQTQVTVSRVVSQPKDKEPSLSDFYIPKKFPEHSYQVLVQNVPKSYVQTSDCLKVYKLMQTWE